MCADISPCILRQFFPLSILTPVTVSSKSVLFFSRLGSSTRSPWTETFAGPFNVLIDSGSSTGEARTYRLAPSTTQSRHKQNTLTVMRCQHNTQATSAKPPNASRIRRDGGNQEANKIPTSQPL